LISCIAFLFFWEDCKKVTNLFWLLYRIIPPVSIAQNCRKL
jgi:hypothetical protein